MVIEATRLLCFVSSIQESMLPQPPSSSQGLRRASRLDRRTIYHPAEIPTAFQRGNRQFEASRPITSEAKRFHNAKDRYVAETTSYFPKIRESAITRDKREKHTTLNKQTRQVWKESLGLPRPNAKQQQVTSAKPSLTLDQDGVAAMRLVFERCGRLNKKDFTAEMLYALNAQELEWEQQVAMTHELSCLYQQADLHGVGVLTWEDLSSTILEASDTCSPDEDTSSQRVGYQTDALNMPAELRGMYYFEGVDRMLLQDTRLKGFRLLDASSNSVVSEFNCPSRGVSVLDAVYSPVGRYVITASTSSVITLYDVDKLRIRQQIPTETVQTALELDQNPATTLLYSSSTNGQVHVSNLENLSRVHSFFQKGHEVMTDIAAITSTSHLATSCMDGKIYVLDLRTELVGKVLHGHTKGVTILKYCSDKGYLVSGGLDHCVNLWSPHFEQKIGSLKGHEHQLIGLEVIPDSQQVISADESGLIKIWDLRKFAPVRTFNREAYVKGHTLPRALTRPMRTMCYMPSRKRIAIAHSTIFFVDLLDKEEYVTQLQRETRPVRGNDRAERANDVEECSKPIVVMLNGPSHFIVVITPREFQSWAVDSGKLVHRDKMSLKVDVTSVALVEDQYSCILGTEDGTVARTMLPRGAVILSKRLHSAEVAAIRWVSGSRQVVSSSFDGTVLISFSTNFEVIHTLNHWQGLQSLGNNRIGMSGNTKEEPLKVLDEEFKRLFHSVDYPQTGKITTGKADGVLHPRPNTYGKVLSRRNKSAGTELVTLTAFQKNAQTRQKLRQRMNFLRRRSDGTDAAAIDIHNDFQHLITVSPFDGTFCVWKLKGGTVVASGSAVKTQCSTAHSESSRLKTALVGSVIYLNPYPYFVVVEEGKPSQLTIWSCKAIVPAFPYGYQRILSLPYSAPTQEQCTSQHSEEHLPHSSHGDIIGATTWISGFPNYSNLFCVGDRQGQVTIYNFDTLFTELDGLQESSKGSTSECNDTERLLSSLVTIHSTWLARNGEIIRIMSVLRGSEGSSPILAVTFDSGATSFFTTEGLCLGGLDDQSVSWHLTLSTESYHDSAAAMLHEMKTQRRITRTLQHRQLKEDSIRNSTPTTRPSTTPTEYSKQRPGFSRFLAVANQL